MKRMVDVQSVILLLREEKHGGWFAETGNRERPQMYPGLGQNVSAMDSSLLALIASFSGRQER